MKKFYIVLLIIFTAILVGYIIFTFSTANSPRLRPTSSDISIPNFAFEDYNGVTHTFEELNGSPLLLNSWASWCPFCIQELPDFAEVQKEFGDKVTIIPINRGESLETARKFSNEVGAQGLLYLLDPQDSFYKSIQGFAMPITLFVNSDGTIQYYKRGFMGINEMRSRIQTLLESN